MKNWRLLPWFLTAFLFGAFGGGLWTEYKHKNLYEEKQAYDAHIALAHDIAILKAIDTGNKETIRSMTMHSMNSIIVKYNDLKNRISDPKIKAAFSNNVEEAEKLISTLKPSEPK